MNPYSSPTLNVNMNQNPGYSEQELAAMQLAAMQDYLAKEQAHEDLQAQGYGKLPYFLGGAGGMAAGGVGGYQLGKLIDRGVGRGFSPLARLGGAALGGLGGLYAGRGLVSYLENRSHPGLREAKESALADYYNASQYLEETGDIDPRLYERTRLMNRISGVPQHPVIANEKEYNAMMARQKAEELRNMEIQRQYMEAQKNNLDADSRLKKQQYYDNLMSRFAEFSSDYGLMEKLSSVIEEMEYDLTTK